MAMEQQVAGEIERTGLAKEPEWLREYLSFHDSLVATEHESASRPAGRDERGKKRA